MSGKLGPSESSFWSALALFSLLHNRLSIPADLVHLIDFYGPRHRNLTVPLSHLRYLDKDAILRVYEKSNARLLEGLNVFENPLSVSAVSLAVAIETIGEHVLLPISAHLYLISLCASRRWLVPNAHFDLNWALCLSNHAILNESYPVPLVQFETYVKMFTG